jgi:hypothetical protein
MPAHLLLRLRSLSPTRLITCSPSAPRRSSQVMEAVSTAARAGEATPVERLHELTVLGGPRCLRDQPPVVDKLPDFSWSEAYALSPRTHITCTHAQKKVNLMTRSPAMFESCSQDLGGGKMVNIKEADREAIGETFSPNFLRPHSHQSLGRLSAPRAMPSTPSFAHAPSHAAFFLPLPHARAVLPAPRLTVVSAACGPNASRRQPRLCAARCARLSHRAATGSAARPPPRPFAYPTASAACRSAAGSETVRCVPPSLPPPPQV